MRHYLIGYYYILFHPHIIRLLLRMEQYIEHEPPPFELITENVYLDNSGGSREKKKAKKMVCECQFDPGMLWKGCAMF